MTWAPDYVTASDVANYLGDDVMAAADMAVYARFATSASRAIDRVCNRQFGKVVGSTTRVYRRMPAYSVTHGLWLLDIDDLFDATGMTVNGSAYATYGTLLPDDAPLWGRPWTHLGLISPPIMSYPGAPITFTLVSPSFGWSAVPAQVPDAALVQCARWNFRRDAPAGVAGSPDQGSEIRLLSKLDPDVATKLLGLVRPRKAG
jgi:hypothetical protein